MAVAPTLLGGQYKEKAVQGERCRANPLSLYWTQAGPDSLPLIAAA
jgi:hypothetical protein